jgi:hypothetical protein
MPGAIWLPKNNILSGEKEFCPMLRKRILALAATTMCGWTTAVHGQQARVLPPEPVDAPVINAPATAPRALSPAGKAPIIRAANSDVKTQTSAPTDAPHIPLNTNQSDDCCVGGLMGGASLYFLRPHINNNTALTTTTGIGSASVNVTSDEIDWNYHTAPAFWLGWTNVNGVGFRARYFQFDHDSETLDRTLTPAAAASTTITPPAGISPLVGTPPRGFQSPGILLQDLRGVDALSVHSDLLIQTIDGEATYTRDSGSLSTLIAMGGRYLQMHQDYRGSLVNRINPATSEISLLHAGHNFYGGGPTLAGQATWRVGGSGLGVFASARGSYLVGSSRSQAAFSETIVDPLGGNQNNFAISQSRTSATMPILEVEGGLEYGRLLSRSRLFIRGAVVNHTYFDAGSPSSTDGNLSLFGAQVSVGVDY